MRWVVVLTLVAGCSSSSTCTPKMPCNAGNYRFCQSGSSCAYQLSDGTVIPCDCNACEDAVGRVQSWCGGFATGDLGPSNDLAVRTGLIPKVGPPYTGPHTDPGLTDEAVCPDALLEPNDGTATATKAVQPAPGSSSPKIVKVAICPTGPSPKTGAHDRDYYSLQPPPSNGLTLRAQLFYDITFGDLDLAVADANGNLLVSDGTSLSNACVTLPWSGFLYVVVTGANDVDVNTYELKIDAFSTAAACP